MEKLRDLKTLPMVTIVLIGLNVSAFLVIDMIMGIEDWDFFYRYGAMYVPDVLNNGQWYRVITHMFMHADIYHLGGNMIMLWTVGYTYEKRCGSIKFLIIYMVGGLGATLASALYEIKIGEYAVGIGASGATMAIFAFAMIIIVKESFRNKENGMRELVKVLILLGLMVFGNMSEGIDWMAHLGGAVTGLVLGILLYRSK